MCLYTFTYYLHQMCLCYIGNVTSYQGKVDHHTCFVLFIWCAVMHSIILDQIVLYRHEIITVSIT